MKQSLIALATASLLGVTLLQSCANPTSPQADAPTTDTTSASGKPGKLQLRANGEDFVRQGFVSKDGWEVSFDHVYVNLAEVMAYQTDPPFDATAEAELEPKQEVVLVDAKSVDLAEGDETADPVLVAEVDAPPGRYNALSWRMVKTEGEELNTYPVALQGTATRSGETVNFTLRMDQELAFVCGDFVGDERKGIVAEDATADLEATFHFDHLFGDAETAPEDALNTGALGFDPLAAIAQNGELDVDMAELQSQLSDADYTRLLEVLPSLGHVGEGHCQETSLT
ncbi:DUF4382 domain-containing protein [Leptolyngbya sp. AN02str]|uniref:DUF4382 domain-containing protein n=1 Tax=Leptolyngbya sp. AN02str TaxID=3423363 RepID=UPI003D319928